MSTGRCKYGGLIAEQRLTTGSVFQPMPLTMTGGPWHPLWAVARSILLTPFRLPREGSRTGLKLRKAVPFPVLLFSLGAGASRTKRSVKSRGAGCLAGISGEGPAPFCVRSPAQPSVSELARRLITPGALGCVQLSQPRTTEHRLGDGGVDRNVVREV